jgi:cytochrome c oxidase cbb3-type subunit 3
MPPGLWILAAILIVAALSCAGPAIAHLQRERMQSRLLVGLPNAVAADPELVRFATSQAMPLYEKYCASCHGADMRGRPALGTPNLTDGVALYGEGSVFDIERTILYGIRAGTAKTRALADMPAFGLRGELSSSDIRALVQYLMQISGRPYEAEAANEGRAVFTGQANCGDCHGADARGNPDYGAPDLTANVWNSGGDAHSLYNAIYFGQHRMMPAWHGVLPLADIRALAVYLHSRAHTTKQPENSGKYPGETVDK